MTYTAFQGFRRIATGDLPQVAISIKDTPQGDVLVFEDVTGRQVDLDMRETPEEIRAKHDQEAAPGKPESSDQEGTAPLNAAGRLRYAAGSEEAGEPRGRGRPRLGVVAREVTLLPRHWDWLGMQPGGASVALRKLVDEARRNSGDRDRIRAAQETTYRFISAIAGNLPGFEEASRALFAYDRRRFGDLLASWPEDVRDYAIKLAFAAEDPAAG